MILMSLNKILQLKINYWPVNYTAVQTKCEVTIECIFNLTSTNYDPGCMLPVPHRSVYNGISIHAGKR
jgi:hypothetical protein